MGDGGSSPFLADTKYFAQYRLEVKRVDEVGAYHIDCGEYASEIFTASELCCETFTGAAVELLSCCAITAAAFLYALLPLR